MEKFCKNCGCSLHGNEEFCPECGSKVVHDMIVCKSCGQELDASSRFCNRCGQPTYEEPDIFCANCGGKIRSDEDFCSQCGYNLNAPEEKNTYTKKALLIFAGIVALVFVIIIASGLMTQTPEDVGTQEVEVGSTDFIIPGDYVIEPSSVDVDYKYSSAVFTKGWTNPDGDAIYISTMTVPYNVDAQDAIAANGGVAKNIMGHNGYYIEDDDTYTFTFESGGYVCMVLVSSPDLFDDIECLG